MINHKGLRLANMLFYKNKVKYEQSLYVFVTTLSEDNYKFEYEGKLVAGNDDVLPIVLSERLLKRLGYEKGRKDNEYEILQTENNISTHIIISRGADCFNSVRVYAHEGDDCFFESFVKCPISYLHEFQNAYYDMTRCYLDVLKLCG